jgi:hypothetical protein
MLILWFGSTLCFFSVGNAMLSGFGGAITDCGNVENLDTLNEDAKLYGDMSCYANIGASFVNFVLSVCSSIFVPSYLEAVNGKLKEEMNGKMNGKSAGSGAGEANKNKNTNNRTDLELTMLNGEKPGKKKQQQQPQKEKKEKKGKKKKISPEAAS